MRNKRKSILLFDDDYESMVPFKEHLEEVMGLRVELTAEAKLLERLADECFDLICVDLMIHPVSLDATGQEVRNVHFEGVNWQRTGLEFLRRLRQGKFSHEASLGTSPQVPVIVLSAVASYSVEDELEANIRVESYVEKPFALETLVTCIDKLLQE